MLALDKSPIAFSFFNLLGEQLSPALDIRATENESFLICRKIYLSRWKPDDTFLSSVNIQCFSWQYIQIISTGIFYWPCWLSPLCWLLELRCGIQHLSGQCCLPLEHSHLPFLKKKTHSIKFYCIANLDLVMTAKKIKNKCLL